MLSRNKARCAIGIKEVEVLDSGFEKKENIKKLGFDDRILVVKSALLGDTAKDTHSFTKRLIR